MELLRIDALSPALRPAVDPVPAVPATAAGTSATTVPALAQAPAGAAFLQALQTAVLPDTLTSMAGLDFALENALRFGSGVGTQAPLGSQPTGAGLELIRDAAAVLRVRSLPPQGGDSNAFLPSQPPFRGVPSGYVAPPIAASSS
ncbi:MAG: hypothetical protein NTW40_03240, partial [Acidobacteria bacterium]|nr:hypothetical protein [Acidobacteriota bacterium]